MKIILNFKTFQVTMGSPDNQEADIICKCFQVTEHTIKSCIANGNLKSIEEVTEACGAGGGCQSCHMLLQLFLDQHQKKLVSAGAKSPDSIGSGKKSGFFSKLFARS